MIRRWILGLILALTVSSAMARSSYRQYDITISRLATEEERLIHEQKRTIGLQRTEIDRQLRDVRKRKAEAHQLRAEAMRLDNEAKANRNLQAQRSSRSSSSAGAYRPPEPDWKTVETPMVVVKGTMQVDGEPAALVSGGQIVRSNEVFATTYKGEARYWRAIRIDGLGASFERVTETGEPYAEPEPQPLAYEAPPPEKPSVFHAVLSIFR